MEKIKMSKVLLLTAIGIFILQGGGSIAVVHASIIGDFAWDTKTVRITHTKTSMHG